ncbi:cAMP-dependent protein kinase type II regulatory subunit-like, partial [Elysia marginata]
ADPKATTEKEISRVDPGGFFGELALVTRKPRAASVYAIGPTKCAILDVHAFERLMGPCMDIMKRNIDNYESQLTAIFGGKTNISDLRRHGNQHQTQLLGLLELCGETTASEVDVDLNNGFIESEGPYTPGYRMLAEVDVDLNNGFIESEGPYTPGHRMLAEVDVNLNNGFIDFNSLESEGPYTPGYIILAEVDVDLTNGFIESEGPYTPGYIILAEVDVDLNNGFIDFNSFESEGPYTPGYRMLAKVKIGGNSLFYQYQAH